MDLLDGSVVTYTGSHMRWPSVLGASLRDGRDRSKSARPGTGSSRRRVNWSNVVALVSVHVGALGAFWTFTLEGLVCCLVMVTLTLNLGILLGFHRLLSHRSLRVPRWLELSLACLGTTAAQAGPITWVALHRKHHAHSDRPGDPHSPSAGWWWAYLGWTYHPFDVDLGRWAKDILADPAYRRLERWSTVLILGVACGLYGLGQVLGGQRLALSFLVWGFFVRIVYTWHATFLVNAIAHAPRRTARAGGDHSRDVWWLAVLPCEDGWHGTHHRQPQSARPGYAWYHIDVPWLAIRTLEILGLAVDVKRTREP
jgi:fatty-acid desaturase